MNEKQNQPEQPSTTPAKRVDESKGQPKQQASTTPVKPPPFEPDVTLVDLSARGDYIGEYRLAE